MLPTIPLLNSKHINMFPVIPLQFANIAAFIYISTWKKKMVLNNFSAAFPK